MGVGVWGMGARTRGRPRDATPRSGNKNVQPKAEQRRDMVEAHSHLWWSSAVRCRCCCCRSCSCRCYCPSCRSPLCAVRSSRSSRPTTVVIGLGAVEVQQRLHLAVEERSPTPLPRDLAGGCLDVRPRGQQQLRGSGYMLKCMSKTVHAELGLDIAAE